MKKLLILLAITAFALVLSGLCSAIEIAAEAELAAKIEAPMVIAKPADAEAMGGPKPDEPSRGLFVWAPDKPLQGGPNGDKGFVQFIINIPKAGKYAVWARVLAWDGNSDSFWVTWNPADPDENPQVTKNTQFRWGVAGGNTWHWDRVNHWLDGGTFDREWNLPAGPTTLTVWTREDACMLDCIFITDNLSATEAEVNPRIPTDADLSASAVKSSDKLATTWSSIRSTR